MSSKNNTDRAVAIWLLVGVGMTIIQIALGGITRLTGSGLSITEWKVVTGSLPPLNEAAWWAEFNKYKATPQFQLLNSDFGLDQFKFIFFWEWFHRLWARLIGLVFAGGFVFFLVKGYFRKAMVGPLASLFLLGALQGAVGWIMVASGLTGDAVYVKPTRLALHFILALGLLSYTFWFALQLLVPDSARESLPRYRPALLGLLFLLVLQLLYGALMAGHKAANVAATWPTINGDWLPAGLFREDPVLLNFIDNTLLVHFVHRGLAYLLAIGVLWWGLQVWRKASNPLLRKAALSAIVLVLVQVALGIGTVLASSAIQAGHWGGFEWLAQIHQLTGMCFLLSLVSLLYLVRV